MFFRIGTFRISNLEFWSADYTSIYENSELTFFENIKYLGETSINWSNDLLGTNACNTLESYWQSLWAILQEANTTSLISKWGTFLPVWFSVILIFVLPCNFIVSGVKSSI